MRSCTKRGSPHPSHCPSSQLSTVSAQALVRLPDKLDQNPIHRLYARFFCCWAFFRKGDDFPSSSEEQGLPFPLFPKPWGHCNLPTSPIPLPALWWAQYPRWHRGWGLQEEVKSHCELKFSTWLKHCSPFCGGEQFPAAQQLRRKIPLAQHFRTRLNKREKNTSSFYMVKLRYRKTSESLNTLQTQMYEGPPASH